MSSQAFFTGIQGGDPFVGFASGALSSAAGSAWSVGAGKFAESGVGMVAFGTVSGGAGATLTGGNFWQGAATGLVVSGLNHLAHKVTLDIQQSKNNGEIFSFGDKNNEKDNIIFDFASTEIPENNTIKLVAHASTTELHTFNADEMNAYLMKNSKLYKESITSGKSINIKIFACSTGVNDKTGFAYNLSKINRNAVITAPSKFSLLGKNSLGIENGGVWNEFKNGNVRYSDFNNKFNTKRVVLGKLYKVYNDYKKNQ